ncbi:MAG TPA: carboxypeptidase regulatory-like domain-containing protein [Planctomycetaceae bacterium]|nr:carboxypeptidase regulatory-like domain-containing protein [Planctomycetaceae bacterium]
MSRFCLTSVVLLTAVGLVGCGGGGPKKVKVTGTVTLDGKPVDGAAVAFSPKGEGGQAAGTMTDASGRYEMEVVPGSYGVKITKSAGGTAETGEEPAGSEEDPSAAYAAAEQAGEDVMGAGGGGEEAGGNLLPAQYADPATSGFSAEVKDGAENVFNFDMKSGG